MDKDSLLKYADAEDKYFGVAGMVMALVVYDCEDYIDNVSTDRADIDTIEFTPDFLSVISQGSSARNTWNHVLNRLRISTALMLSNIICRNYVRHFRGVNRDTIDYMRSLIEEEADNLCQLEHDEADALFFRAFDELDRTFRSRSIHDAAMRLVNTLKERHSLSRFDILDIMQNH